MIDIWKQEFDWTLDTSSGNTYYYQKNRQQYYVRDVIDTTYETFRYNKCLSGTCWSYINSLEDIYKVDLYTGDGYSNYNVYTEYDSIEEFFPNFYAVDIIVDEDTDLTKQFYKFDNVIIKPGYRIQFINQVDSTENLIYTVGNTYFLNPTNLLDTREQSYRFKTYCKSGTYKDKQFTLSGSTGATYFPISGESMYFVESESFLLRHFVDYDIMLTGQTSGDCAKIIFTDYDLARKQLSENSSLYNELTITIETGSTNYILYEDISYIIVNSGYSSIDYNYVSGYTNTTSATTTANIYNDSGTTYVTTATNFIKNDDFYINLKIYDSSGYTYLDYKGFIDSSLSTSTIIALKDYIPNHVLYEPIHNTAITYEIENLQYTNNDDTSTIVDAINSSPFNKFISAVYYNSTTMTLTATTYNYLNYFDYDGLTFTFTPSSYTFNTYNNYINYQLQPFMERIYSGFTTSYTTYNSFALSAFTLDISLSGYTKITPDNVDEMEYFRQSTYVTLSGLSSSIVSLILKKYDTYLLVESGVTNLSIITNINTLGDISNLLYSGFTTSLPNNVYKNVAGAYGQILSEDSTVRNYSSGIIHRNDNRFIFKIYNKDDEKLTYYPSDLVGIGTDLKTMFPLFLFDDDFEYES